MVSISVKLFKLTFIHRYFLKKKLKKESMLCSTESMKVLKEFDDL